MTDKQRLRRQLERDLAAFRREGNAIDELPAARREDDRATRRRLQQAAESVRREPGT